MSKMTKEVFKRAISFVNKVFNDNTTSSQVFLSNASKLKDVVKHYVQACQDYNSARLKYLAFIEKYEDTNQLSVAPTKTFPGVYNSSTLSSQEMIDDTDEMKTLANTIRELASQIDVIENELRVTAKNCFVQSDQLIRTNDRLNKYMDEIITGIDSAYDTGLFAANIED